MASCSFPFPTTSGSYFGKRNAPVGVERVVWRALVTIAEDLGLDEATVYRYVQTYRTHGLTHYLAVEQPGYWGLTSAQLAGLCREPGQTRYPDCRAVVDELLATYRVRYSVSSLMDRLHRLGDSDKSTTAVPCRADSAVQTAFLAATLAPLLTQTEAGEAVVHFADAAHPTPNTRAPHVWTETGKERQLLTNARYCQNKALNTWLTDKRIK